MIVKWRGVFSSVRQLPGGGPQGCHLGGLEYGSQSNDSGQCVADEDRYKFVDDMSILEVINLITCGLDSYNFTNNLATDIIKVQNLLRMLLQFLCGFECAFK